MDIMFTFTFILFELKTMITFKNQGRATSLRRSHRSCMANVGVAYEEKEAMRSLTTWHSLKNRKKRETPFCVEKIKMEGVPKK